MTGVQTCALPICTTYDMYRGDYSRSNTAPVSGATNLYASTFYVINTDYRVYICLQNGTDPDNPTGRPSLDEPTFTDLEPRNAGSSGDNYIWKYLYTIKPADIIKFDSTDFMPEGEKTIHGIFQAFRCRKLRWC